MEKEEALAVSDTVAKMFWRGVQARAGKTFCRQKEFGIWKAVSWTELGTIAREIGMGLASLGYQPGDVVSILSNTREEWVFADLGALGAGGLVEEAVEGGQGLVDGPSDEVDLGGALVLEGRSAPGGDGRARSRHRDGQEVRPARPGGSGVSDRPEMGIRPPLQRRFEIRHLQRRRGRPRRLYGPQPA